MAVVVGGNTTVEFGGHCVISANWGFNPNPQRLFCIGSWDPYNTYYRPTETLNLTIYAPGTSFTVSASTDCEAVGGDVSASVNPASCGSVSVDGVDGMWYITGYSFSKEDALMPGQESWSLTKWVSGGLTNGLAPTYVVRGIAEGQGTSNAGITFVGDTAESTSGSVSAGGMGRADTLKAGVVASVGGGSDTIGETGQGSAQLPVNPLYLE
jgi:hypothetical protein